MAEKNYDADKKVKSEESISKGSKPLDRDADKFKKEETAKKESQSMGARDLD
ncbi:MAG: hypothetical protein JST04_01445 [Bdellovibrionales bacterium]|nr:hypothetical protein [Bdellovibrionales bacterium]